MELTHGGLALKAHLKHFIVLRGECKLSFGGVILAVEQMTGRICDL